MGKGDGGGNIVFIWNGRYWFVHRALRSGFKILTLTGFDWLGPAWAALRGGRLALTGWAGGAARSLHFEWLDREGVLARPPRLTGRSTLPWTRWTMWTNGTNRTHGTNKQSVAAGKAARRAVSWRASWDGLWQVGRGCVVSQTPIRVLFGLPDSIFEGPEGGWLKARRRNAHHSMCRRRLLPISMQVCPELTVPPRLRSAGTSQRDVPTFKDSGEMHRRTDAPFAIPGKAR